MSQQQQELGHLTEQLQLANARVTSVHKAHLEEVNNHLETKAQAMLNASRQATALMQAQEDSKNKQAAIDALQKTVNALTAERDDLAKRLDKYEPQTVDAATEAA